MALTKCEPFYKVQNKIFHSNNKNYLHTWRMSDDPGRWGSCRSRWAVPGSLTRNSVGTRRHGRDSVDCARLCIRESVAVGLIARRMKCCWSRWLPVAAVRFRWSPRAAGWRSSRLHWSRDWCGWATLVLGNHIKTSYLILYSYSMRNFKTYSYLWRTCRTSGSTTTQRSGSDRIWGWRFRSAPHRTLESAYSRTSRTSRPADTPG